MFTLYGFENNPRTRIVRIVAEAVVIPLELFEVVPRQNINRDVLVAKFPLSGGKIPALTGPNVSLTETLAITIFLSKINNKHHLLGNGTIEQEAQVLSWMSWANEELINTLAKWFLPLIPNQARPAIYDHPAVEAGKASSLHMLDVLETAIGDRKYLVGDGVTLADIFVAIVVSRGLEWVLGAEWRAQHLAIMRHFQMISNWEPVKAVVPHFVLIEQETRNEKPQ